MVQETIDRKKHDSISERRPRKRKTRLNVSAEKNATIDVVASGMVVDAVSNVHARGDAPINNLDSSYMTTYT